MALARGARATEEHWAIITHRRATTIGAALVWLGASFATDASAASLLSCYRGFKSACGEVKPSEGRLQACFESNFDKLSKACGDKLSHAAAVAKACEQDARKFCGGVRRAAEVANCMRPRLAEVGEPFRASLARVGVKAARRR